MVWSETVQNVQAKLIQTVDNGLAIVVFDCVLLHYTVTTRAIVENILTCLACT